MAYSSDSPVVEPGYGQTGTDENPDGLRQLAQRIHDQADAIEALADQLEELRR